MNQGSVDNLDPADAPAAPVPAHSGPGVRDPGTGLTPAPRPRPGASASYAWTLPQRRSLLLLLACLTAGFGVRYACTPVYVTDPQPARPSRYDELADRIDPNTADVPSLAALPTLGNKRAETIVAFRDAHARKRPGEPAFKRLEDLAQIKGIGPATLDALQSFLVFPEPRAASRPAR